MQKVFLCFVVLVGIGALFRSFAGSADGQPVEAGKVNWGRDHAAAVALAKSSGKPLLILFQEIPGCAGCQEFGREVLSDAAVVEKIEGEFVPLLIHNNKGGEDGRILKQYGEPAWNFQVVRFFDATGKELVERRDGVDEKGRLMARMEAALAKAGPRKVTSKRVAFAQHCFWTGEMEIGGLAGVVRTEAGFINGREVTLVDYDPSKTTLDAISSAAAKAGVNDKVYKDLKDYKKAPASDQKRQMQGTRYEEMTLTPEQATKVNAWVRRDAAKAAAVLEMKK